MIRLLDRYVGYQFLRTFVLLVLGLPLLFVVTDLTDHLNKYLDQGLTMRAVALSYVYQVPLFVVYSFPIAALVATVFTIGGMTGHLEVSAAKAAGVSFYRLMAPIAFLSVLLSVAGLGLGELVPVTNRMRAEVLGIRKQRESALRTNFVFQTERSGVLSVRRLDPATREMSGVVVERKATPWAAGVHGLAETARWTARDGWKFGPGYLRVLSASGEERTFSFTALRIPQLRETPEELLAEPREPEEMRYAEMSRFIEAIERSGGDAKPLLVDRAQKIALPLATLVIVLFGAPLSTSSQRGGAAYGIGISLVVTLIYMLLFRVCKALGSSGAIDPMLAAWTPNALFFFAGVVLLSRVRT